jgi:hypothetical protein
MREGPPVGADGLRRYVVELAGGAIASRDRNPKSDIVAQRNAAQVIPVRPSNATPARGGK